MPSPKQLKTLKILFGPNPDRSRGKNDSILRLLEKEKSVKISAYRFAYSKSQKSFTQVETCGEEIDTVVNKGKDVVN